MGKFRVNSCTDIKSILLLMVKIPEQIRSIPSVYFVRDMCIFYVGGVSEFCLAYFNKQKYKIKLVLQCGLNYYNISIYLLFTHRERGGYDIFLI